MRFTAGRPAILAHTFEDDTSDTPLTPASVTATVTRLGATVPALTTATVKNGTEYSFTAYGLSQGVYTVSWAGDGITDTETVEFVGGHLFTVGELRDSDVDLGANRFPRDRVLWARDLVSQEFETITNRSFTPRTVRVPWLAYEPLPRLDVASVTLRDNTGAVVPSGVPEEIGPFTFLPDVTSEAIYSAELDYGFRTVPLDVKQAALIRARTLLFESNSGIPDRATSFSPGDGGTFVLSTAGRRGATTGIPDVDAVLKRYTLDLLDAVGGFW